MADHANWICFTQEEIVALRRILATTPAFPAEVVKIQARLDQYTSAETTDARFRDAAFDIVAPTEGDFDHDDCAVVSRSDEGAYVMCWVWVSNEDAGIEEPEDEEGEEE
jgi:hypothetical protein